MLSNCAALKSAIFSFSRSMIDVFPRERGVLWEVRIWINEYDFGSISHGITGVDAFSHKLQSCMFAPQMWGRVVFFMDFHFILP